MPGTATCKPRSIGSARLMSEKKEVGRVCLSVEMAADLLRKES